MHPPSEGTNTTSYSLSILRSVRLWYFLLTLLGGIRASCIDGNLSISASLIPMVEFCEEEDGTGGIDEEEDEEETVSWVL